ncbi:hypothetical protein C8J56DRAFT_978463, partial [Mycena floridula]
MIMSWTIMGLGSMRIMGATLIRNIRTRRVGGARCHQSVNARFHPSDIAHVLLQLLADSREASRHCPEGLCRRQRDQDELRHQLFHGHRHPLPHGELLFDGSLVLPELLGLRQSSRSRRTKVDLRPRYLAKGLVKMHLVRRRREQDTSEIFRELKVFRGP